MTRRSPVLPLVGALLGVLALVACNDVGDSSAVPGNDAAGGGDDSTVTPAPDATGIEGTDSSPGSSDTGTSADTAAQDSGTAEDTSVADSSVEDANVADTNVADANVAETSVADTSAPDTSVPDTGADTGPADSGVDATPDANVTDGGADSAAGDAAGGDSGAVVPCTVAGQAHCVPCSGNSSGLCTPTEAAFVAHDIAAGHAATTDCYTCLFGNSCLDDTQFNDTNHECGDLAGDFDGGVASALCMDTLACVLSTGCAGPNDGAGAAAGIPICYCGPTHAGTACQTAPNPDGVCLPQEVTGLGVYTNAAVLKDYTDTTRPSGMANQIFSCAQVNGCTACLQ